ncbi:MAG: NAD(P)-dependent oxidoreductase [Bryobacteraceae bacterium]|nr:NAD(P)-dependent oxidoreductase [Bryobacteraceae bacterium]
MFEPGIAEHRSLTGDFPVLVWGGTGFIGMHLVRALLNFTSEVRVLSRSERSDTARPWGKQVRWFQLTGNETDEGVMRDALASVRVVYNLAGSSGAVESNRQPKESLDSICGSQLQFLAACAHSRARPHVVFSSSWLVYGPTHRALLREDSPLAPGSMYASHKLCAEHYHQISASHGAISYTICRISNVFGPDAGRSGIWQGFLNSMIRNTVQGNPITLFGDGRQVRDFLYIDDVVEGMLRCGIHPAAKNQVFNFGRGNGISIRDAADEIHRACPGNLLFAPWPPDYEIVESGDCLLDTTKLCKALAFRPRTDFPTGIAATISAMSDRADTTSPEQTRSGPGRGFSYAVGAGAPAMQATKAG